ncbi:MAG: DUF1150 family protein [Proteobacteria bacterium]|nr:DUF1150 family protein [Pseudomonadota bacterium]
MNIAEPNGPDDILPDAVPLAYVKAVDFEGVAAYAIHAADGTQLAIVASRDLAFATVRQHDMNPVSVH